MAPFCARRSWCISARGLWAAPPQLSQGGWEVESIQHVDFMGCKSEYNGMKSTYGIFLINGMVIQPWREVICIYIYIYTAQAFLFSLLCDEHSTYSMFNDHGAYRGSMGLKSCGFPIECRHRKCGMWCCKTKSARYWSTILVWWLGG